MRDYYLAGLVEKARQLVDDLPADTPRWVRHALTKGAQRLAARLHTSNPESARNVAKERAGLVVHEGGKR